MRFHRIGMAIGLCFGLSSLSPPALAAVQATGTLGRVVFSSFEHGEIWRLRQACPEARCGLLWDGPAASRLNVDDIAQLPADFTLHLPLEEVKARPAFWKPYAPRLVLWGMSRPQEARGLGFRPAALIADGLS